MGIEDSLNMQLRDCLPLIQSRIMNKTYYFGIKTLKNPLDFWVYQEVIHEMRPDVIVEIGNNWGGSTLALAHVLDRYNHGRVIGIDIDQSKITETVSSHSRISLIEGDAIACFGSVVEQINQKENVLIIEDSSHTYENTLGVLKTFCTLIKAGGYFIVEDSICHHGLDVGPSPGPYEAIDTFIQENPEFEIDREKESFLITWNPKGFLRRKLK